MTDDGGESPEQDPQSFYTIEAPGTIRSNSRYNVVVSLLQANESCTIGAHISGGASYSEEQAVEVEPMTIQTLAFDVPELEAGDYFLEVTGSGGLTFSERIKLNFSDNRPLIYIQLDKQGYKRMDNVDFRALFLDNNTRPATINKPIRIVIKQNEDDIVAEFDEIELRSGLYTGQWTIPDDVLSGIYIIEVFLGDVSVSSKSFEILNYEEPKFVVILRGSRKVPYEKEVIHMAVEASYADGTPVIGRCTVAIQSVAGYYNPKARPIEKSFDINGAMEDIVFDMKKELCVEQDFHTEDFFSTVSLAVNVSVEEADTGTKETLTDLWTITKGSGDDKEDGNNNDPKCSPCGGWFPSKLPRAVEALEKPIAIDILTEEPKLGEPLSFEVSLYKPSKYFVYFITARGNIVRSELVAVEEGEGAGAGSDEGNAEEGEGGSGEGDGGEGGGSEGGGEGGGDGVGEGNDERDVKGDGVEEGDRGDGDGDQDNKGIGEKNDEEDNQINEGNVENGEGESCVELNGVNGDGGNDEGNTDRNNEEAKEYGSEKYIGEMDDDEDDGEKVFEMTNKVGKTTKPAVSHTITFDTSFELVPRAFILAYYIYDGELFFEEIGVNLQKEFENTLEVEAPHSGFAGEEIELQIKSDPNSLVGLMAVDEKSMLLESKNDLSSRVIFKALHKVRSQTPWLNGSGEYPGLMSGLVTFTNARWKGFIKGDADGWNQQMSDIEHMQLAKDNRYFDINRKKKEVQRKIQERNQTFGNWLFLDGEIDDTGRLLLMQPLPKKPTTWLLSVVSVNPSSGFAMTRCPIPVQALPGTDTVDEQPEEGVGEEDEPRKIVSQTIDFDVDLYEQPEYNNVLEIAIPEGHEAVAVEFTVSTNLFGPTLAELTNYAGIMYCTGMLHMTTFLPNVVILEHLKSLDQLESELAVSIIGRFEEAMRRQLAERREDGGFPWFGCDEASSPHVTALVIAAFQRVSQFVPVEASVITDGLNYLASQQTHNGDFFRESTPYRYPFQPDVGVGLTATILLTFLQNDENMDIYRSTIDRACDYILTQLEATKCRYDLAVAFYALQLLQHPGADDLKERILDAASTDADQTVKWWTYFDATNGLDPHYNPPASNLEVTSFMLLGLLETEPIEFLVPIVKWLMPYGQKLGQNHFSSESMDCAISLDAVLKFARKSNATSGVTEVIYKATVGAGGDDDDGEENMQTYEGMILVDPSNASVIKTHLLPKHTSKLEFSTTSKGSFKGNLTYRFEEP